MAEPRTRKGQTNSFTKMSPKVSDQLWPITHVPADNWARTFIFGDSWDVWRHHEEIGLLPSSSRFEHNFTVLKSKSNL